MASENIIDTLKKAKDEDILIGGKYDSDIYRLAYILNRLVEITDLEELEVYMDEKPYAIRIFNNEEDIEYSKHFVNNYAIRIFNNEEDIEYSKHFVNKDAFIQDLKRLISVYYHRADAIRTRCMIASSLADYYTPMLKLKLEGDM